MIVSGEAPGNSALRTEHLADRFGVSATPVREALMSLSGEGLVELRPGRGFRVVEMSRQDFIDIYDTQAHLAGELAARATSRLTDEDLARLHAMQDAIVAAVERGDAAAERIEWDLHALINRLAKAEKLRWLLRLTVQYAPFRAWFAVPGWSAAAPQDHLPILRGMGLRNPAHRPRCHDGAHPQRRRPARRPPHRARAARRRPAPGPGGVRPTEQPSAGGGGAGTSPVGGWASGNWRDHLFLLVDGALAGAARRR